MAVGAVLLIAGCASGGSSIALGRGSALGVDGASVPVGTGLFATDNTGYAVYLKWRITGTSIAGNMQVSSIRGTPPSQRVSADDYQVSGDITHGKVHLGLGKLQIYGTYTNGVLTLHVPRDGMMTQETYSPAYPAAFNWAVQHLQMRVQYANWAALVREQVGREPAAIVSMARQLAGDISALKGTSLSGTVRNIFYDVQDVEGELQTAHTNMHKYESSGTSNDACLLAASVAANAQGASDAFQLVARNVRQLGTDMSTSKTLMQTAQDVFAAYQRARRQLHDDIPDPPVDEVASAVQTARTAIDTATAQANQFIGDANTAVMLAYQLADQANYQAGVLDGRPGGCGPLSIKPRPAPVPQFPKS